MDAIAEILLRLFFEIFGELILTGLTKLIGFFFKKVDTDTLFRKRLKFVLTYVFIGLIITLVVSSLLNSTRFLVVISLSYMLFQIVLTLLGIINKDRQSHPLMIFTKVLKKLGHYAYPILLIVFSSMYIEEIDLLATIITLSSITLVVWFSIDMYRLNKKRIIIKTNKNKKD